MRKLIGVFALMFFCLSCAREGQPSDNEGYGILSLNVWCEDTKAGLSSEELLSEAWVGIYYADFSGLIRQYKYSEMPETIYLPANQYRVDVVAGEKNKPQPENPSWEQKSYCGSTEFTITPGKPQTVVVNATCCNAIAKVNFAQTVAENFEPGYKLTVQVDSLSVQYQEAQNGAEVYFLVDDFDEPQLHWSFEGVLTKGHQAFSKQGSIPLVEKGKRYELNLKYIIKHGDVNLDLEVDYTETLFDDMVVFEPVSTGISPSEPYEIWATRAWVHADVDQGEYTDPSEVGFEYSRDGKTWTAATAQKREDGSFQAQLGALTPSTDYSYRLVIKSQVVGEPVSFRTADAPSLPNGGFEYSTNVGSYSEWYSASAPDLLSRSAWWGSGNGSKSMGIDGSADMGYVICAPDTGTKVEGNQSACLSSCWAVVKFAAGNLFSGYFGGLVGTKGGICYFGRPFTGRPSALRVSLKYSTAKVNRVDGYPANDPVSTNDYDRARVFIALGDWSYKTYKGTKDCPIQVNTTDKSTFHDFKTMAGTIAYGEKILKGDSSNSHNKWVEYVIPLDYNSVEKLPEYIIVSCASSMLGDYFTGSESSKLWVDKMELIYE